MPDAVVVGAGPNGLAAAIALARAGHSVRVLEAAETIGGGSRSAELTLPGFTHDVCSAVHPHPLASPFLRELPLAEHGLELVQPELPLAHPLDDGTAVAFDRSIDATAESIGGADGEALPQAGRVRSCATRRSCCRRSSARCGRRATRSR